MTYFGGIAMGKNENKGHCSKGQCFAYGKVWLHFFPRLWFIEDGYTPFGIIFRLVLGHLTKRARD